ncbi:hypothetical protein CYMTET_13007 [Cymbomonas tetramitiformis]|uniref:Uncharacterized protein n=1 Tax=Cymbomonas tetramitiformis TaxID=36881 RepID=A0AAE0LBU6_9CHLO|nr:hypothetical protein CYMTET_13007 [Cymbomonas tetramitiformis]
MAWPSPDEDKELPNNGQHVNGAAGAVRWRLAEGMATKTSTGVNFVGALRQKGRMLIPLRSSPPAEGVPAAVARAHTSFGSQQVWQEDETELPRKLSPAGQIADAILAKEEPLRRPRLHKPRMEERELRRARHEKAVGWVEMGLGWWTRVVWGTPAVASLIIIGGFWVMTMVGAGLMCWHRWLEEQQSPPEGRRQQMAAHRLNPGVDSESESESLREGFIPQAL